MIYDPKTKTLRVRPEDMDAAYGSLMWSLKNIRETAGLPLDAYQDPGTLDAPHFAMKGILDAMEKLGMEAPARWGHEIDLRNVR